MLLHTLHSNTASLLNRITSAILIPSPTLCFLHSGFMMAQCRTESFTLLTQKLSPHLTMAPSKLCCLCYFSPPSHCTFAACLLPSTTLCPPVASCPWWCSVTPVTHFCLQRCPEATAVLLQVCRSTSLQLKASLLQGSALQRMPNIEGEVNGLLCNMWWMPGLFNS